MNAERQPKIGRAPDRQRYRQAVNHVEAPDIPFMECEVDYTHVNKILGQNLPPVRSYLLDAGPYVEFLKRTGMDMAYLHVPWSFGRREIIDERGINIYAGGTVSDYSDLVDMAVQEAGSIERRMEEMLAALDGTNIGIMYALKTPEGKVREALGYEKYYLYLMEQPDFIRDFMARAREVFVDTRERVLGYPVDALRVSGPPCSKTGWMMSMEMMEALVFPDIRELVSRARWRNVVVSLHADGNHSALYPHYIDMGIDVCDAIEKCAGAQDVMDLKRAYGENMAFHGTIDVEDVLIRGRAEDVGREVEEHIRRLGKGGGYICGSSHDINEHIPHENFVALIEAAVNR